jgi:hypothetical protein
MRLDHDRFPARAGEVRGFLGEHYRDWRAGMAGLSPDGWAAPPGPSWGPYAEASTVDLALHVLDEVVHHGAEVGLLRDFYSHRGSLAAARSGGPASGAGRGRAPRPA